MRWRADRGEAAAAVEDVGAGHPGTWKLGERMDPLVPFVVQLAWFLVAWSLIAYFALWPWSARLSREDRLSLWIAPEMFRVLGVGLLVPALSPGMPSGFAIATAAGDSLTALLAALAFLALQRRSRMGLAFAWACTLVGALDLLVAFPHAAASGAISHLATQWYVPVLAGPVMVVSHVACFVLLLQREAHRAAS